MSAQQAFALPLPVASNTVVINARCNLRIEADHRVIVVAGLPLHHCRAEATVADGGTKGAMRRAGWRGSVARRVGAAGAGGAPANVCAASRCGSAPQRATW